ncbi:MAG: cell wall biosynthesis protein [Methanobrevibacter sp.]|jgi:hypothetical protein|nr:cell wall biosynthesis protein [Candidatus Methanoflexus mossambicus]
MIETEVLNAFIYSLIGTLALTLLFNIFKPGSRLSNFYKKLQRQGFKKSPIIAVFKIFGNEGYLKNLHTNVRGWTPRAIGIVPFIVLSIYLPRPFNDMVLIIGVLALIDDLVGRRTIGGLPIEWGQLLRGLGMLAVMIVGYPIIGLSAILIAFLIQPLNIADMQPGSASFVVIVMSIFSLLAIFIFEIPSIHILNYIIPPYYTPAILLAVCLGYAPLDFLGKIMMGEVGNHSFAIALGITFYMLGGFVPVLILFIVTCILIAFIRKNNLKRFFTQTLNLKNPTFGDYFMDVLTGGGLGDLIRKIIFGRHQVIIKNPILIALGFRRLTYNPFAINNNPVLRDKYNAKISIRKRLK